MNSDQARAKAWFTDPEHAEVPGGETLAQVAARVLATFNNALSRSQWQTIVFVGHDVTNRIILLDVLGMALSRFHDIAQDFCGVSRFSHDGTRWSVESMNETAHLIPTLNSTRPR